MVKTGELNRNFMMGDDNLNGNSYKTGRKLRIGYIWQYESTRATPGTASILHIQAILRGLQNCGHQVRLVTVRNGVPQWSEDLESWQPVQLAASPRSFQWAERGSRALQARLRLPYFRFFESYRFSRACKVVLQDMDVAYERFWMMGYGGLLAARQLEIPLVYEVNGDLVEEYTHLGMRLSPFQWSVIHWITRWMFSKAAKVITVSETLRQTITRRWRIDPTQVTAVSNGAHVSLFAGKAQTEAARAAYGLNGNALVMFVGGFQPWHGLDLLLEAFGRIASSHPNASLVFVGDGPVRLELEKQARQLGLSDRVVFTGEVPHAEVAALLGLAQVAVVNPRLSPASSSQSPLKLFEYMAAGKAIVAPAVPTMLTVLTDQVNALLVKPDEVEALANAVARLLDEKDLRTELGKAAQQQALERHSWDQTVKEVEQIIYDQIDFRKPASVKDQAGAKGSGHG